MLDALEQARWQEVCVIEEACRAVHGGEREQEVWQELERRGAKVVVYGGVEMKRWRKE